LHVARDDGVVGVLGADDVRDGGSDELGGVVAELVQQHAGDLSDDQGAIGRPHRHGELVEEQAQLAIAPAGDVEQIEIDQERDRARAVTGDGQRIEPEGNLGASEHAGALAPVERAAQRLDHLGRVGEGVLGRSATERTHGPASHRPAPADERDLQCAIDGDDEEGGFGDARLAARLFARM